MNTHFRWVISSAILFNLLSSVLAFQPSGGVLRLDGVDDYAILSFDEHGALLPEDTHEFTIEMWLYPKAVLHERERNLILSQQVALQLLPSQHPACQPLEGQLCCVLTADLEGDRDVVASVSTMVLLEQDRWHYLAIIYKDSTYGRIHNNSIFGARRFALANGPIQDLDRVFRPKDLFVGGYDVVLKEWKGVAWDFPVTSFHGNIDAIRISDVARYDLPVLPGIEPFDPPDRFEADRHTLALWNFDERQGATRFVDASGHGKTLIGMNGASVEQALAVNPASTSLTTTWGAIKSKAR